MGVIWAEGDPVETEGKQECLGRLIEGVNLAFSPLRNYPTANADTLRRRSPCHLLVCQGARVTHRECGIDLRGKA